MIIRQLREAGAVILGKTNLGEWANFRGNRQRLSSRSRLERARWRYNQRVQFELYVVGIELRFREWRRSEFVLGRSRH